MGLQRSSAELTRSWLMTSYSLDNSNSAAGAAAAAAAGGAAAYSAAGAAGAYPAVGAAAASGAYPAVAAFAGGGRGGGCDVGLSSCLIEQSTSLRDEQSTRATLLRSRLSTVVGFPQLPSSGTA